MAEPVELSPEQLLIKKVIDSQPQLNTANPSSWVQFSNDLKHTHAFLKRICHAEMIYTKAEQWDQLITAAPFTNKPINLRYYQFLINGPFRGFSDKISLEVFPGTKEHYIRCTDLDKWPANILYNFCIATRVTIEHQPMLERWEKFLEAGVDPSLAFIVSAFASRSKNQIKDDPWAYVIEDSYLYMTNHFWFDASSDWCRIIDGDFLQKHVSAQSYKQDPIVCRPTNMIWGDGRGNKQLLFMSVKDLSAKFGLPTELVPPMVPKLKMINKKADLMAVIEAQQNNAVNVLNQGGAAQMVGHAPLQWHAAVPIGAQAMPLPPGLGPADEQPAQQDPNWWEGPDFDFAPDDFELDDNDQFDEVMNEEEI